MKKLFLLLVGFFLLISSSYASSVEGIIPMNTKSLDVTFSEDIVLPENNNVEAEVKVLKDLLVSYAYKDSENSKKVTINLTYDLKVNGVYSLLAISGTEGDVDFTVSEIPTEISVDDENIEKINITDSKNIEIYYKNDIGEDDLVYKVLRDLGVKSLYSEEGQLRVDLETSLETFSSYILLLTSLKDISGDNISFDEIFYNFDTKDYIEDYTDENSVLKEEISNLEEETGTIEVSTGNVEEVAMNSPKKTPDTGAATWVLVLLTLGFSSFYFIKSRTK